MSALRGIKEKYLSLQKFPNSEFQIPIRPRSSTDRIKDSGSLDLGSIPSEVTKRMLGTGDKDGDGERGRGLE